ncbi:MAG: radical SAM protein [Opitutales bacterium]|nr:radical SAM protein [Opitutales bacterium]
MTPAAPSPSAAPSPALTDRFQRRHNYLRISVTDRCNLRCAYCMPAAGLVWRERAEILSYEEIGRLAQLFVRLGVDRIRLTGGEPTMRRNLPVLLEQLRALPGLRTLLMSTNGVLLAPHAARYRAAGLDGLNVSLDTLRPDRFVQLTRRDEHANVLAGLAAALAAGFPAVKFMPFDRNEWSADRLVPYAEMRARIEAAFTLSPLDPAPHAVAKEFAIAGGAGRLGFVTSMTEHFCTDCNRLRLTADGKLKSCLFSTTETDLRTPLRAGASDAELTALIRQCLLGKWAGHPPMAELAELDNRAMIQIGG